MDNYFIYELDSLVIVNFEIVSLLHLDELPDNNFTVILMKSPRRLKIHQISQFQWTVVKLNIVLA